MNGFPNLHLSIRFRFPIIANPAFGLHLCRRNIGFNLEAVKSGAGFRGRKIQIANAIRGRFSFWGGRN